MRRVGWQSILIALMVAAFSAGNVWAETMYVKKARVKVTAQKSPTSKVVATLRQGDPVQVVQKSGRHYKVRLRSGKTGWIFKFKLSLKKAGKSRGGGDVLALLAGESSIAAREARSGGSIRGLKEVSETYAKNQHIDPAYKQAVEEMERLVISEDELTEFQQEGSVGEFAGGP